MGRTRPVTSRIEPAYYSILEIIAKRENMTVSEYVRAFLLMPAILQEFGESRPQTEPPEYYFSHARNLITEGLERLAAEKGKNTLDRD